MQIISQKAYLYKYFYIPVLNTVFLDNTAYYLNDLELAFCAFLDQAGSVLYGHTAFIIESL